MVRIINYKRRESLEGKEFFVLILSGGVEMIQSLATGNYYLTGKKTSIPCTFDEATCKALIGTELPGNIVKLQCNPYEYTIKDTGEVVLLEHQYVFMPEEQVNQQETQKVVANVETFSKNGVGEAVF